MTDVEHDAQAAPEQVLDPGERLAAGGRKGPAPLERVDPVLEEPHRLLGGLQPARGLGLEGDRDLHARTPLQRDKVRDRAHQVLHERLHVGLVDHLRPVRQRCRLDRRPHTGQCDVGQHVRDLVV